MSETTKCHKREKVLMGVVVEAVMPIWPQPQSIEEEVRATEEAVAEFQNFLRDLRAQDRIRLFVRRKYADVCSCCGCEWEPDDDDGDGKKVTPYCAQCGTEIEEIEE